MNQTSLGQCMELATENLPQPSGDSDDAIVVLDTFWGYIIGPGGSVHARARRAETMAVFGALFFGGIAFVPWLVPASSNAAELMPFRIAVTAIFFCIAGLLYLMANKGMSPETQVDMHEREFRIVRRNRAQESVTLSAFDFDQVEGVFITRSTGAIMYANLCIKLRDSNMSVVLATAPERLLTGVKVRLDQDLHIGKARTKRPEPFATTQRPATPRPSIFGNLAS